MSRRIITFLTIGALVRRVQIKQVFICLIVCSSPPTLRQHMLYVKLCHTRRGFFGIEIPHVIGVHIQHLVGVRVSVSVPERIPRLLRTAAVAVALTAADDSAQMILER